MAAFGEACGFSGFHGACAVGFIGDGEGGFGAVHDGERAGGSGWLIDDGERAGGPLIGKAVKDTSVGAHNLSNGLGRW